MIGYIISVVLLVFGLIKLLRSANKKSLNNKHVVVTGGSSGIGKEVAKLAAKEGANVTIVARNIDRLHSSRDEIKKHCVRFSQVISTVSADVSNFEEIQDNLLRIEKTVGPIYMLINCAGFSVCGTVEDLSCSDINSLINVNYFGTLYPIKALIKQFKERKEGVIVLTSSMAGLVGLYGYSAYSSSKFALRGLAEALYMELKPYNVTVTLSVPPDTDTPGFETENKSKPLETKLLAESGGLHKPETVAKQLLDDALAGKFFSYVGFEGLMLTTLCIGMSPFRSVFELIIQILLMGPFRLAGACYNLYFDYIIKKCYNNKLKQNGN